MNGEKSHCKVGKGGGEKGVRIEVRGMGYGGDGRRRGVRKSGVEGFEVMVI